jgi:predicted AAA+ superfamily ATPase
MSRQLFDQLISEAGERRFPVGTTRDVSLPSLPGKADALVGMRRVGKTWRMFQHRAARMAEGIPASRLLYINLEDERVDIDVSAFAELEAAWLARFPEAATGPRWLYLDEVQVVPGWERFVRRLLDDGRTHVVVTGSSSRLLSDEIATSLRGRALTTEVLPFSFREACRHAEVPLPERGPPTRAERAALESAWRAYMDVGGFPEVQTLDPALRRRVLRDYVDVVVLRDVIERHGIGHPRAVRWLGTRLLGNPAGRFSVNKLYRDLSSQGVAVRKGLVYELVDHLEDAHLIHSLPLATASVARRNSNPRKAYPVDPALSGVVSFLGSENIGHRLETLVYLHLRRLGWTDLGYLRTNNGYEVDFSGRDAHGRAQLVQVCVSLDDPATRARELRALGDALNDRPDADALLLTTWTSGVEQIAGRDIPVMPVWRWMLGV